MDTVELSIDQSILHTKTRHFFDEENQALVSFDNKNTLHRLGLPTVLAHGGSGKQPQRTRLPD